MLLAIDIGNTHTVFGLHREGKWVEIWRKHTNQLETEDELAAWFLQLSRERSVEGLPRACICASVVPAATQATELLAKKWFQCPIRFLESGESVGLPIQYYPPESVGADRIANALGAIEKYTLPAVIVDFGTATTFDVISGDGVYLGGAIFPGVEVSMEALSSRAAKLPQFSLKTPKVAIGTTTRESLQSGHVFGYVGAIHEILERISDELGTRPTIVGTGGLATMFGELSDAIEIIDPTLTLDGLVIAAHRLGIA